MATAFAVAGSVFASETPPAALPEVPSHHRVLILADQPGDAFMALVKAEVSSVRGVDTVMRAPVGSLDADARAEHAEVAVRKLASGKGVEVWMADATSGRSLLRQLVVDESPGGPDQSLIALQTAELLRTSLFPKHAPSASAVAAPPPLPPANTVTATSPAPSSGKSAIDAGVGLLYSRGGVSPSWQAWLSFQHLWSRHLGMVLDLSAPLARGSVGNPQGTADVGAMVAGAGLLARVTSDSGRLFVATSLGAGVASVLFRGQALPNLVGSSTRAYSGLLYLRVSGGFSPTRWLGLGAAGILGTTTSRIRIQFANHDVGEWGLPLAAAIVYGEVAWE
jgi:hypothetical protein